MSSPVGCSVCGQYESETMFFRLREGGIICSRCYRADGMPSVALEPGVLAALRQRLKEIESGEEEDAKKY